LFRRPELTFLLLSLTIHNLAIKGVVDIREVLVFFIVRVTTRFALGMGAACFRHAFAGGALSLCCTLFHTVFFFEGIHRDASGLVGHFSASREPEEDLFLL
jgi:hypothetical protein